MTTQTTPSQAITAFDWTRDSDYHQLLTAPKPALALMADADLEPEYIDWHQRKNQGTWRTYDAYDYCEATDSAIIQERNGERHKYGTSVQRSYHLLTREADGSVTVQRNISANKVRLGARSTYGQIPGAIIAHIRSGEAFRIGQAVRVTVYKIVRLADDGSYRSCWDDSSWELGKTRTEACEPGHGGGFYAYREQSDAQTRVIERVFGDQCSARLGAATFAVLECEAWGREISYGSKRAFTSMRPLAEIDRWTREPGAVEAQ